MDFFQLISITAKREVVFSPASIHWLVGWLVGFKQDNTETTEQISTILGCRMGLSPEKTLLTFGALLTFLTSREVFSLNILVNFFQE